MNSVDLARPAVEKALDRVASFVHGGEDAAAFAAFSEVRVAVDHLEAAFYDSLKDKGLSWSEIGALTGVTKQAAFMRYGRLAP